MTIPEHLMIGFSFANIFYAIQSLFKFKKINYLLLVLLLAIAAAFPDIDSFFGYYTSTNPLIGHRGATHSIAGAIVSGFILTLTALLISAIFLRKKYLTMRVFFLLFFVSSIAGISHVLADLPQPPSVWKGIPVFFPLKSGGQYMRHGGWSLIGWYDYKTIWLLVKLTGISFAVLLLSTISIKLKLKRYITSLLLAAVIIFNCGFFVWTAHYIAGSKYVNRKHWEKRQTAFLKDSHPLIKKITIYGRNKYLGAFMKTTR